MNFLYNENQKSISDLARKIFSDAVTDEALQQFHNNNLTYMDELWLTLATQGLLGTTVPEHYNGSDLGIHELCLMLEEQGRTLAPIPLFSSLILGALPLCQFGNEEQQSQWLPALTKGNCFITAAIAETGMTRSKQFCINSTQLNNGDWLLNGIKTCIPDGGTASGILIPAIDLSGDTKVFIVDTKTEGVHIETQKTSSHFNTATVTLNNVQLSNAALIPEDGVTVLNWLELHANTALCALQLGACEEALKRVSKFTSERKQFSSPIGSFQAVAMQAADAYIQVEAMRSTYWSAVFALSKKIDARLHVATAKYWACLGGHKIVHTVQHLHGGIGSDISYPIHRFFLWAKHIGLMLGGATQHLSTVGHILASTNDTQFDKLQLGDS